MANILVVDDEQEIADLIELYLQNEDYTVYKCYNPKEALRRIEDTQLDLAILDVMMPEIDGFTLCQKIREKYNYPVIMLTAKEQEIDKITGLTLGADDYMTKPFRPLELMARVKAQLRRFTKYNPSATTPKEEKVLEHSSLMLNRDTHECTLNEKPLALTPTEFSILWILCENRGQVISSERLFHQVWGDEYFSRSNNTVTVHIRHLREKMQDSAEHPKYIKTVWGVESDEEIRMSPEMTSMATKLNTIKNTLEKRARSAQEAEQRKNDLVVYLAHDIKTPLTSVIGYLSLLEEALDMPPEQKAKYVKITLEKAYRLESLINEFFEITRYNLQKISLEPEQIDLRYMLEQMADEFYPMLEPQGKKAVVTAEEGLSLYGDPNRLARVFNNILKNAVAYSAPNSLIQIEARQEQGQVLIQFKNRGRTIPPEKLQTIFEKFYRLDEARSSNTGGAGLGLAIAKEIVTLHGGTIAATSLQGETVFTVLLPQKPANL